MLVTLLEQEQESLTTLIRELARAARATHYKRAEGCECRVVTRRRRRRP